MKLHYRLLLTALPFVVTLEAAAQDEVRRSSSSLFLHADTLTHNTLPFSMLSEGRRFEPTWGLDQAWISEQNLRKGINHMGKENIGIGRTCYRFSQALVNDSALGSDAINRLRERNRIFNILSTTLPMVFTADQEAGADEYFVKNKVANVDRWAANINSHVHWLQQNTKHPVAGISPFNEPDYWSVEEGATINKSRDVAKLLKEQYPRCADVAIVGGNTLNNDKALEWYNGGKQYYDWGNTHQLAGSMVNYIKFYQQLAKDGKVGYNDEMHNVAEAMIGLEYGMTVGIWWGFDSRARGEFCDISRHGRRIGYVENRTRWTSGSVWQHDDGRVKAFLGSSERQAVTTDYELVALDHEVYFDGHGPTRHFYMQMPGGAMSSYQKGQTNAERVIDVTWGSDVPACAVTPGTYKLVNKATGQVAAVSGDNVLAQPYSNVKSKQWIIAPCSPRIGGDYSFYDFALATNGKIRMDVRDYSTQTNANVMAYTPPGNPTSNQQWYLVYDADGYYFIRNRESALYLTAASSGNNIIQSTLIEGDGIRQRQRQLWRILPVDTPYDTEAPSQPTSLIAESRQASVALSWAANTEEDLAGYQVLRAEQGDMQWNTIARELTTTRYVDNTCRQGVTYIYKVKAVDQSQNQSECSETVTAQPTGQPDLIAHWSLNGHLLDQTANEFDAVTMTDAAYVAGPRDGMKALDLSKAKNYVQLPYQIADCDELTVAMWVNWQSSSTNLQRLFDFGSSPSQYLYLTPSSSSIMSFVIKDGDKEQTLSCSTRLTANRWKHVAVTIGRDSTVIYVDGERRALSTGITIRPSDIRPVLNYLGRGQSSSSPLLSAWLADVRVYNYALSASDIVAVMNDEPTAVDALPVSSPSEHADAYTLGGRRLSSPSAEKGLLVKKGKKYVSR